jgi:IS5 family transposase
LDGKRKTTYEFNAHVNEDGFVKAMEFTAGNLHDSQVFTRLLSGDEEKVFANNACASEKINIWLADHNIDNNVLSRVYRNKKLTYEQKLRNKISSRTRYIVERFFYVAKLHYGLGKARYLGLKRNKRRVAIIRIAHNSKRGMFLQREIEQLRQATQ